MGVPPGKNHPCVLVCIRGQHVFFAWEIQNEGILTTAPVLLHLWAQQGHPTRPLLQPLKKYLEHLLLPPLLPALHHFQQILQLTVGDLFLLHKMREELLRGTAKV